MSTCSDDGTFGRGSKKTMDLAASAEARGELLGDGNAVEPTIDWGLLQQALEELAELIRPLNAYRVTYEDWQAGCRGATMETAGELVGDARCGHCVLCTWDEQINEDSRVGRLIVRTEPREQKKFRWSSLSTALSELVEWRNGGAPAPSSMGPILDRARRSRASDTAKVARRVGRSLAGPAGFEERQTVTVTGTTGGSSQRENPVMRRASEMGELERCILMAAEPYGAIAARALLLSFVGIETPAPKTTRQAPTVRLLTDEELADALNLEVGEAKRMVKHTRRRLGVDLRARGLLAMPRRVSVRMLDDVDRRRQALEARASA